MGNLKVLTVVLAVCLVVSLLFNGYFYIMLSNNGDEANYGPAFFSFVWSPEQQNITEGPLYVNMTFERTGNNLSVTIKINDDDYNVLYDQFHIKSDTLIICFDSYGNDSSITLDDTFYYYGLRPDNTTVYGNFVDLELIPHFIGSSLSRDNSDVHYCTFKLNEGYIFNCTFPISGGIREICSDVITLRYIDVEGSVCIPPFHFGVDVS